MTSKYDKLIAGHKEAIKKHETEDAQEVFLVYN